MLEGVVRAVLITINELGSAFFAVLPGQARSPEARSGMR